MHIRLLNLDRSPDRLASFIRNNAHLSRYRRTAAIDGNTVDRNHLIASDVLAPDLRYTKGAIGCALSHLSLWREAIQTDRPLTIVEDDVVLAKNFAEETERLIGLLPDDWEHVTWGWGFDALMTFDMLPGYSHCTASFDQETLRQNSRNFAAENVTSQLFRIRAGFGLIGYSISPRGARRLIDFCLPLRPMSLHYPGYPAPLPNTGIDNMMAQLYPHMAAYVAVPPLVVTDNDHATSTVQTHLANLYATPEAPRRPAEAAEAEPTSEFILVGQGHTILSADVDARCLRHLSLNASPLNLCLSLANGATETAEVIDFEAQGIDYILVRFGEQWVLRKDGAFASLQPDGSVAWLDDVGKSSALLLLPAEGARLCSPNVISAPEPSSRRRLLMIAPWVVVGGADKVNLDLVTGLKTDLEITFVTTQSRGPWLSRFEAQVERLIPLGELLPPDLHPTALAFLVHRLAIDVVLLSNTVGGYRAAPFLRENFPALPILDLVHGEGGKRDNGGFPRLSALFDQHLTGRIVITDYLRDLMIREHGISPDRITRIYNGVDLAHFAPVTRERSGAPTVAFVGRLNYEKHPEHVVAIARELPEGTKCRFLIGGDGPLTGALAALLPQARSKHPIEMLGRVDDVRALLAATDVLLLTSEIEGLPVIVLEAMAMGIPVLCSAVGGICELVRDGIDGYLVPYDSDFVIAATTRLDELLNDPERRVTMGRSARARVEEKFGLTSMVESYRKMLCDTEPRVIQVPTEPVIQRSYGGDYFAQKLKVGDIPDRIAYFRAIGAGRRVLHVGCTDYPIFDPNNNLHVKLNGHCAVLDGLDSDAEGIKTLSQFVPGRYFCNASDVTNAYDLILVPETIEHVHNVCDFLTDLDRIDFAEIVITAPCLIGCDQYFSYADRPGRLSGLLSDPRDYFEEVHPDHKAWFTPYTLANCVQQFTNWSVEEIMFLDGKRMTAVRCSKPAPQLLHTHADGKVQA